MVRIVRAARGAWIQDGWNDRDGLGAIVFTMSIRSFGRLRIGMCFRLGLVHFILPWSGKSRRRWRLTGEMLKGGKG